MAGLRRSVVLALSMWAVAACSSSDDGGSSLKALGVDDGAEKGVSTSQQVTGEKDVRLTLSTGALLELPQGALDKSTKIGMERPSDTKALDLVGRFKTDQDRIASAPYVLTPHGTKFKEDVTITLPLAKTGSREVSVAWLEDENDKEWKKLGVAKSDGKSAQITLKHFSVLVVIEDASDLPKVEDIAEQPQEAGVRVDAGAADAGEPADGENDAGVGAVRDAGSSADLDASAMVDAGDDKPDASPVDRDASGSGAQADGGTYVDASDTTPPDAGTTSDGGVKADAGNDAGIYMEQYDKLMSCGLVTLEGNFSERGFRNYPLHDPFELCVYHCFGLASCMDEQIYACDLPTDQLSVEVATCMGECAQKQPSTINCPDADAGVGLRCDGVPQCANGADELDCDPSLSFDCGNGERIPHDYRCDNEWACTNGVDEEGCFSCDSGRSVKPWQVCDGVTDCNDTTDEQGCAEISCPIITQ